MPSGGNAETQTVPIVRTLIECEHWRSRVGIVRSGSRLRLGLVTARLEARGPEVALAT